MQYFRRIIVLLCCIGSSSAEALVSMRRIGAAQRTPPRALLFAHQTTTRVEPAYRAFAPVELPGGVTYAGYQVGFVTAYIRSKRVPQTCGEWLLVERKKGNGFQPNQYSGRV